MPMFGWRFAAWLALVLAGGLPAAAVEQTVQIQAASAQGAVIRVLDKVTGAITDVEIARGQTKVIGRLIIVLGDCRYPVGNPNSDAWAWLDIRDDTLAVPVFGGWMTASSPALNGLDHARYDVWVLRCSNS
ncbi:DUF2155 domain-containing protein [Tropicimonas sp.]|uniref:DUF2155 domain-containing protein n=1 Tax=Tropicimonas sp. TaxID=2067044 RepID=UPI003A85303E